ncbi:envelope glycoprotein [Plecturocebus cupreus]
MDLTQSSFGDEDMFVFFLGLLTPLCGFLNVWLNMDFLPMGGTDTLIPRFRCLHLTPQPSCHRCKKKRTTFPFHHSSLPTWTQMKRLSAEAARLVDSQNTPCTPAMMFIAVLAILSCQVPGDRSENQALWAYVPDPPALRPVTWNDPSFPVYLNDTSILGFPSSSHITPQVAKYDFTAQAADPPIPDEETYVNRDWGLVYNGIKVSDNISSPDFPEIKRERCRPSNQSLDPSPPGMLCYPKQKQALSYTLSTGFTLFYWSVPFPLGTGLYEVPGGWSTPIFTTPSGHVHSSLWKLFTAIIPSFVCARFRSTSYPAKQTVYVQACVASPYALLYGDIKIAENNGHYSITCSACTLTNCLDSTVFPPPVILIVHQPPYVMLPVNISGAWYDDRELQVLQ